MHLKGRIAHSLGVEETILIERAVVSAQRISLDWNQDGRACHLIAKSPNGSHFEGRYNFRSDASDCECELTLYKSNHEDLLYGTWRQQESGQEGTLVIRLPSRRSEVREPSAAEPQNELPVHTASPRVQPAASVPTMIVAAGTVVAGTVADIAAIAAPAGAGLSPVPKQSAAWPVNPLAAKQATSAWADPLLKITAEQFGQQDQAQLESELRAAPDSAVFKVAHYALADELRALAARVLADRQREAPPATEMPKRPPRAPESPEMRALKRRSSRHGQRP